MARSIGLDVLSIVSVHKNVKKEQGHEYQAILTGQAWSIKGFIIWPKDYTREFYFCKNNLRNPERSR